MVNERELNLRQRGFRHISGIDEAGRGCLAGPVVAAAVVLPLDEPITGIRDSKKLTPVRRRLLCEDIQSKGTVGIGTADWHEIDRMNILQASLLAMRRALEALEPSPDYCLVDGNRSIPEIAYPQEAVVRGDSSCYLIAAASIVAKVKRDEMMCSYDNYYQEYGFARHKGYPTIQHRRALHRYGPSPIHRRSFTYGGVE